MGEGRSVSISGVHTLERMSRTLQGYGKEVEKMICRLQKMPSSESCFKLKFKLALKVLLKLSNY